MAEKETLIKFLCDSNLVSAATAIQIAEEFKLKPVSKNEFVLKEDQVCKEYLFP